VSATSPVAVPVAERPGRPTLRLVAGRSLAVGRLPFALLMGAILAAGLVGLLLLHTLAAQDAFTIQRLAARQSTLSDTVQQLSLAEQQQQSPTALAARARSLGLVPTGSIAFIKLGHRHRIVGVVRPAPAPPVAQPAPASSPATKQPVTKHAGQRKQSKQKSAATAVHRRAAHAAKR
jgi:hypothetical protein